MDVLIEVCKQLPAVAAVIYIMVHYTKAIEKRDQLFENREERWFKAWEESKAADLKLIDQCMQMIGQNTQVLGQVRDALRERRQR